MTKQRIFLYHKWTNHIELNITTIKQNCNKHNLLLLFTPLFMAMKIWAMGELLPAVAGVIPLSPVHRLMVIELTFQLDFFRADITYVYMYFTLSANSAKQRSHSHLYCFGCMCLLHLWKWNIIFLTKALSRNHHDLKILFCNTF